MIRRSDAGAPRRRANVGPGRVKLAIACFGALYLAIGGRLVYLGIAPDADAKARINVEASLSAHRPDVLDRQGRLLATDIETASIFAEPRRMIDGDEAAELISAALPGTDAEDLRTKFNKDLGFAWVKREITPREQQEVHRLGIPGIGFLREQRRVYPNGHIVSHALGSVNVDNQGIAGFEKYIDRAMKEREGERTASGAPQPVELAVDLVVQHAMRDELIVALEKYKAIAAAGVVLDVDTGEIVSFVSLPDYDPNNPADALKSEAINRLSVGVFEMGSTFKALTIAMALDSGKIRLQDRFDARSALQYGRFRIDDFHPTRRVLSVPEVFIHSSNIGTARMALAMGVDAHKAFLKKMGQLDRLRTELPESAMPIIPPRWGELNTVTISFGHGLSVAPLQTLMATAALANGGRLIPPTVLKRSKAEADKLAQQVIKPFTSDQMRYLMRLNAEKGSARKADVPGYRVGGKTGTSEKVVGGRYSKEKVMTAFTAVFPTDAPRYAMLLMLDEPKGLPETHGFRTSGWNVVPVAGKVVARIAPLLGIEPDMNPPPNLPPGQQTAMDVQ